MDEPIESVEPVQCLCGFFGNPQTENLCSKCYRNKKQTTEPVSVFEEPVSVSKELVSVSEELISVSEQPISGSEELISVSEELVSVSEELVSVSEEQTIPLPAETEKKQKKRARCTMCSKKVGLLGYDCRCGGMFCSNHRHPDTHDCDIDYKELGRKRLRRENKAMVADKINNRL